MSKFVTDVYNYFIQSFLELKKYEEHIIDERDLINNIPENIHKIMYYLMLHITHYYKTYNTIINKKIIDLKLTDQKLYEKILEFIDFITNDSDININYNDIKNDYKKISTYNGVYNQDQKNIITRNRNIYRNLNKAYKKYINILNKPKDKQIIDLREAFNDMYVLYNEAVENNILFMIFNLNIDENPSKMIENMINIKQLKITINTSSFEYDFAKASHNSDFIKEYEDKKRQLGEKLYGGKKFTKTSNKVYVAKRERLIYLGQRNRKYIKMKGIMIPLSEAKKLK